MSWRLPSLRSSSSTLRAANCPNKELALTNRVFLSPTDASSLSGSADDSSALFVTVGSSYVYVATPYPSIASGTVALNTIQRKELRAALGDELPVERLSAGSHDAVAITFEVDTHVKKAGQVDVDATELTEQIRKCLIGLIPSTGQSFLLDFFGQIFVLKVASIVTGDGQSNRATVAPTSEFFVSKSPGSSIKILGDTRRKDVFRADFDFEKLGIGGLDKEFSDIFRRAFASRVFPPSVIQKLGIHHVKGMLLYGPPGTGKTLIARQIGKMLNGKEPKVVNGPEILNKYVGQSEENIRNLFKEAETEYAAQGENSELHIIIFDEIDAICKQRGTVGGSAGVHDTVVNQLLSKIDGVNALNNILVIGMTNRKDMIDEALLRPGRLEVHVEISLPDEHGRQQILRIHTAKMRENRMLASDFNVEELASSTKNYSGAEIEGVCKSAAAFALNRQVNFRDVHKKVDESAIIVTMDDFRKAITEIQPAFGVGRDDFAKFLLGGFLTHGLRMKQLMEAGKLFRDEVAKSERTPLLSLLIEGPPGTGKTAFAAWLAIDSGFPFVRVVSPEMYVGYSEASRCAALAKVFDDAHKSSLSVIVLDNIERMIEYAPIGPRFSNSVLQTLMVLIKTVPPLGRRLFILATTSCVDVLRDLDFRQSFSASLTTPTLNKTEISAIVDGKAESVNLALQSDGAMTSLHSTHSAPTYFKSERDRDFVMDLLDSEKLGVKKLLMILNMAREEASNGAYYIEVDRLTAVLKDVL